MRRRSHGLLVALLLLLLQRRAQSSAPRASAPAAGGFWQLTDVHVDLLKSCSGTEEKGWYGSFAGMYGCGCSVATVNATADFMRATAPAPDVSSQAIRQLLVFARPFLRDCVCGYSSFSSPATPPRRVPSSTT